MVITRKYSGKDADMLTACATIVNHAIVHKEFLISKRSAWKDPFFANVKLRVNNAFQNHLGVDHNKQMRLATQELLLLQSTALPLLAEFKIQIEVDFSKSRRTEILSQLGYMAHHKAAQHKDQEALAELLLKFKNGMTNELRTEIINKGTEESLIENIINMTDLVNAGNISQETSKGERKGITAAAIEELNGVYQLVGGIAKIARKFYHGQRDKAALFSYSKIVKAINPTRTRSVQPPLPEESTPTVSEQPE